MIKIMCYNNLPKKEVLKIYDFVKKKRKERGLGQRKIYRLVKKEFGKEINENTIAGWIFLGNIPFGFEKTQFKPLPKPKKEELHELYIKEKYSAQRLAEKYGVSTIIIINWLKSYAIKPRTHLQSMNTYRIKKELREKQLRKPTKEFSNLSSEKAYILGVLCGDGHINPSSIRFEIKFDEEFIKRFSQCFDMVYGLYFPYKYYKKRDSFVLYVSSEIICEDLLKYGKFGTLEWKVPEEILNCNDEKIISNFLRGIYDSEGSVAKSAVTISSVSKKGIKGISYLLKKLGIKNKIRLYRKKYYTLYIFRKERFKIYREKIGFTIKRKQERLNEMLKNDLSYKPA